MSRDRFELNGIDEETKEALKNAALKRFGKANAALMIRALIADHLKGSLFDKGEDLVEVDLSGDVGRFELSLPQSCIDELDRRAEMRLSPRNYYICNLIFSHLSVPQLQVDEVEVLRGSNYQMAMICTNLDYISRAFNKMVKNGSSEGIPVFSKELSKLRSTLNKHIKLVSEILDKGTLIMESKGKGRGIVKTKE